MKKTATIEILRYIPEKDGAPHAEQYTVQADENTTVLQALNEIKDNADGSLAYRWSCRMAICGSCGMMINGRPRLACEVFIRDLPDAPVRIAPLRNFPVMKDLVVDIQGPLDSMRSVMPYSVQMEKRALADGPFAQTPVQREKLDQTSQCIKCMLCYSACPVYGNDKNFVGPAASALAYRYQVDSRDQGKSERMDRVTNKDGVWKCSFVGECSAVCPKRVDPAMAIQRLKVMGALHTMKNLVRPSKNKKKTEK